MYTEKRLANKENIAYAATILKKGAVVAFPTDTVYGGGALPWNTQAVERLYTAKRRERGKPIALLLSDESFLRRVAIVPPSTRPYLERLFRCFWPGGLTVVLPKTEIIPDSVSGEPTIAIRIPDLPVCRDLIRLTGGILAVTSANLSGRLSPVTAQEVEEQLQGRIDFILDGGPAPGGIPSTIVDGTGLPIKVLRHGAVGREALEDVIGPENVISRSQKVRT